MLAIQIHNGCLVLVEGEEVNSLIDVMLKDWRDMAITTLEHAQYLKIYHYLLGSHATSTWMVSRMLDDTCKNTRKALRQMERRGYVVSDSNGSNNIYWSLAP